MYYDKQTDMLYDNEFAMEGIFGKLKEKRESKDIIRTADPDKVAKLLVATMKQSDRLKLSKTDGAKAIIQTTLKEYNDKPGKVNPTISKGLNIGGYPVILTTGITGSFRYLSYVLDTNGKDQLEIVSIGVAHTILGDKVKTLSE